MSNTPLQTSLSFCENSLYVAEFWYNTGAQDTQIDLSLLIKTNLRGFCFVLGSIHVQIANEHLHNIYRGIGLRSFYVRCLGCFVSF